MQLTVGIHHIYRHKVRGTCYVVLGVGKMQSSNWIDADLKEEVDNREVVAYRSQGDGSLWVRPKQEFLDGRFEDLGPMPLEPCEPNMIQDVADFHFVTDTPVYDRPVIPVDRIELRKKLIEEEHKETQTALDMSNIVDIADGLADLIYVAIGTAHEYGIPLAEVWRRVHASNMAKVDPKTGKVRKREDGKVLKPEGWEPPDIAGAIKEASDKSEARS